MFQVSILRLMLNEYHWHGSLSSFARDIVDAGYCSRAIKSCTFAFTQALLDVNDEYG